MMEDSPEILPQKDKKAANLILTFVFIFAIIIITSSALIIYFRIIPTDLIAKSTEPSQVLEKTYTELKANPLKEASFENFYSDLKDNPKKNNELDLGALTPNYDNAFSVTSSYYNYCRTKKVEINFDNSKTSSFLFNYKDKEFTYQLKLYPDLYEFTDQLKSEDCYFTNGQFVMGFLKDPYNQNFMQKLTSDFRSLNSDYSSDEIAEIASIFVQSISYETDITELNRYPYETLYEEKGNCLDKSIILAGILKELGYSVYIILGDSTEYHAVVGINCEKGNIRYSNQEICFIETTKFGPIGENVNITNLKVVNISKGPLVYKGKNYGPELVSEIMRSRQRAQRIEEHIDLQSEKLVSIQKEMCKTDCVVCNNHEVDFETSNQEIKSCKDAKKYNSLVTQFNGAIEEYNNDIQTWYEIYYDIETKMFRNVEFVKRN